MKEQDILRMARECFADPDGSLALLTPELTEFAALVAAAERQRCAQIAREFDRDHPSTNYGGCIARLIEASDASQP